MTSLKWIIHKKRKRNKRGKKYIKKLQQNKTISILRKKSLPASSKQQKTPQDSEYNLQLTKWPEKKNCSETCKRKKEDKNDDNKGKK